MKEGGRKRRSEGYKDNIQDNIYEKNDHQEWERLGARPTPSGKKIKRN